MYFSKDYYDVPVSMQFSPTAGEYREVLVML